MAEQTNIQTPPVVAGQVPADQVIQGQVPAEGVPPVIPAVGADGQPPVGDDKPFEVMGQKFHNLKHFERVMGDTMAAAKRNEAELNAIKMREAEQAKDQQLLVQARAANPGMDDESLRKYIENTKRFAGEFFAEEKQRLNMELGSVALRNYVQANNLPDEVAQGVQALYSVPQMAQLIHTKDETGAPILSFNDLRDWAEAPSLRKQNAELQQKLSAFENGSIAAGAGSAPGGVTTANSRIEEPPLNDYEALRKWRAKYVK